MAIAAKVSSLRVRGIEAAHQLLCSNRARLGLGFFPTVRGVKARPGTCIRSAMFGCGIGMRKYGLEGAGCSTC